MAFEVAAVDEPEELRTGEPAVNQQVIEPDTLQDSPSEHPDGIGNLGLEHLRLAGVDLLVLTALLAVLCGLLLLGEPLWLVCIPAGLRLYGGVQHHLSLAVRITEKQGLEPQDTLHRRMRKHLPKAFRLVPAFGKVGVVKDDAAGKAPRIRPAADKARQLVADGVSYATPVNAAVIHDTIEGVLLAGEQLAKGAALIVSRCHHGEERLQDEQLHQLYEGKLAVRVLGRTHRSGLYDEALHHFADRVDRLAGIIVFEKVFEFRDNLSIFCPWLKVYIWIV